MPEASYRVDPSPAVSPESERIKNRMNMVNQRLMSISAQTAQLKHKTFGALAEKSAPDKERKGANGFLEEVHQGLDQTEYSLTRIESDLEALSRLY